MVEDDHLAVLHDVVEVLGEGGALLDGAETLLVHQPRLHQEQEPRLDQGRMGAASKLVSHSLAGCLNFDIDYSILICLHTDLRPHAHKNLH